MLMGTLSYATYGSETKDVVLYNLPAGSKLATMVALLYMLNIVGSITMTIQPIYALFEKNQTKQPVVERPESAGGQAENAQNTSDHQEEEEEKFADALSCTDASTILIDQDELTEEEVKMAARLDHRDNCEQDAAFYIRRLTIPFAIIAMSTMFPDVNLILSLLGGSICGVFFIIMPVLFYR